MSKKEEHSEELYNEIKAQVPGVIRELRDRFQGRNDDIALIGLATTTCLLMLWHQEREKHS